MIVGIATLIMSIFLGGSVDVFYIDKIQEGVNKNVKDKTRKKELKAALADYTDASKKFNKERKSEVKILKNKNLNQNTSVEWYEDYFKARMEERKELQELFIKERIKLQDMIKQDEWDAIMKTSSEDATKQEDKKEKKAKSKKKDKDMFDGTREVINEKYVDEEKLAVNLKALEIYETEYNQIGDNYESINVNDSSFLSDKDATVEEMEVLCAALNVQRAKMYVAYTAFVNALQENSSADQYQAVIKKFNKVSN